LFLKEKSAVSLNHMAYIKEKTEGTKKASGMEMWQPQKVPNYKQVSQKNGQAKQLQRFLGLPEGYTGSSSVRSRALLGELLASSSFC